MDSLNNREPLNIFLKLLRLGLGHEDVILALKAIDWNAVKDLADVQGLSAVVLDAIGKCPLEITATLPTELKLEWIGEVLQNYEHRYVQYEKAIASLAGWYNAHGFKMMVLKGLACSLDWPQPSHRPCGDIDTWMFGRWREADEAMSREKGVRIDSSHHHHTVFEWEGFSVENHYDFINVHHHRSNVEMEKILKELGEDDSNSIAINDVQVYLPSPNLHALFLLKHACSEFAATGIILRQIADWGFFVEKHGKDVNWDWLLGIVERFGMRPMFEIINAICVAELGFDVKIFPYVQFDQQKKERVVADILYPTIPNDKPKRLFSRIAWKIKRFKANKWKHKLCYNESMASAVWSGVWSHLLKPSSI